MKRANQIFISYRREDSAAVAGRIYDRLIRDFGKEAIFKDVDTIPISVDVKQHINSAVANCSFLLVVIGDKWLNVTDKSGRRRLDDSEDFVRMEIESALRHRIPIVPLLVQDATMPSEESLPPTLKEIANRNGMSIGHDPRFHGDMNRLIKMISNTLEDKPEINGDFLNWVMHHKARVIGIASSPIISIAVFLLIINSLDNQKRLAIWYGIHVILILILFGYTCLVKPRLSDKYSRPSEAVRDFHNLLLWLWVAWMVLYVSLTIHAIDPIKVRQELLKNAKAVSTALTATDGDKLGDELQKLMSEDIKAKKENLEALRNAIILADKYSDQIDQKNVSLKDLLKSFKESQTSIALKFSEGIINFFNNLQSLFTLLLFWVLAFPRDTKKFFIILMIFLAGILAYFIIELFLNINGIIVGIFGGIAMALWVGRLDSKFLMTPFLSILALYFYAILQVTWFVYQYEDEKIIIITGLAMFLKVVIYLTCSWLMESGKLLYFSEEMRLLYGLSEETEFSPMYGKTTVKERFQAFLDDLSK